MNEKLFERMFRGVAPFHQKMLHFNYDLPLTSLTGVLKIVFETIYEGKSPEYIYKTQDLLEYNGMSSKEVSILSLQEVLNTVNDANVLYEFAEREPGIRIGLFDDHLQWYIRIFIEDDDNLGPTEERTGNVEVYTNDELISTITTKLENMFEGHCKAIERLSKG